MQDERTNTLAETSTENSQIGKKNKNEMNGAIIIESHSNRTF